MCWTNGRQQATGNITVKLYEISKACFLKILYHLKEGSNSPTLTAGDKALFNVFQKGVFSALFFWLFVASNDKVADTLQVQCKYIIQKSRNVTRTMSDSLELTNELELTYTITALW